MLILNKLFMLSIITKILPGPKPESEPKKKSPEEAKPEELIPFDEDDDFKDF